MAHAMTKAQGLKPQFLIASFGTTEVVPCYEAQVGCCAIPGLQNQETWGTRPRSGLRPTGYDGNKRWRGSNLRAGAHNRFARASFIFADWKATMARTKTPNFDQLLDSLRVQSFEVAPYAAISGAVQVTKHGVAAVLAPSGAGKGEGSAAALVIKPGVATKDGIARLLDRGFQKFVKTSQFELPATAAQLHAIHTFEEELNLVTGTMGLYNEGLGTTSDLYHYDRLKGREVPEPAAARPWQLTPGH